MSSYKNLSKSPSTNAVGDSVVDSKQTSSGWVDGGTTLSQSAYPELYAEAGLISDFNFYNGGSLTAVSTIIFGDNLFVSGGASGIVRTSTDGITWTARTSGTTSTINALTYGNGLYVYAGNAGILGTSTDAITWTARTSGTTSNINALTYGNGLYVYGGGSGTLRTSTNGITWTARTSGTSSLITSLAYGNGVYVYTAALTTAWSTNAITWTALTTSQIYVLGGTIKFDNGLFLISSLSGYVSTSTDAVNWKYYNNGIDSTNVVSLPAYGNGAYTYIGQYKICTSTDFQTWKQTPLNAEVNAIGASTTLLTYGNNTFVLSLSNIIYYLKQYSYDSSTSFIAPQDYGVAYNVNSKNYVKSEE
jgi:hypothetical protein